MAEWKPWRILREQPDIEFVLCDLPAGVRAIYAERGEDRAILIDRALSPVERLAALAHELVHHERGGMCCQPGMAPSLRPLAAREEHRVDVLVASRLLPKAVLSRFIDERSDMEAITVAMVADEFQVPESLALLALQDLQNERRAG